MKFYGGVIVGVIITMATMIIIEIKKEVPHSRAVVAMRENEYLYKRNEFLEETIIDLMVHLAEGREYVVDKRTGMIISPDEGISHCLTAEGSYRHIPLESLYYDAMRKTDAGKPKWFEKR